MEFPALICILVLYSTLLCGYSRGCDITHECPMDKDLKWARDGKACHVFHNQCFLDNVNCYHGNNNIPQLVEIVKEECQKLCVTECPEDDSQVCGYLNEEKHTFANQCEMDAHVCQTGEATFVYGVGPCD